MHTYFPEHFNSLPTFRQAQENLKVHKHKIDDVGRVLHAHGLADEIGIALLHRHFELSADEILVEKIDSAQAQSVGAPRPKEAAGKVLPHLFRAVINENDGTAAWFPVEFCDAGDDDGSLAERCAKLAENAPLLNEVAQTLRDEFATGAFGLSLFHGREEIQCTADEVLTESTDEIGRTLVMRPGKLAAVGASSTPTLWRFDGVKPLMNCTCQTDPDGGHQHHETN
jgi:hypothetical protein